MSDFNLVTEETAPDFNKLQSWAQEAIKRRLVRQVTAEEISIMNLDGGKTIAKKGEYIFHNGGRVTVYNDETYKTLYQPEPVEVKQPDPGATEPEAVQDNQGN